MCDRLTRKLRKVKEKAIARGKWQGRGGPRGGSTASTVSAPDEVSCSVQVKRKEQKILCHEVSQPCHEAWLMGGLG